MKVQQRGTCKTLTYDDGSPIEILTQTMCTSIVHTDTGTYVHLTIPKDGSEVVIEEVDTTIRQHADIQYSPWLRGAQRLVTKKHARCDPLPHALERDNMERRVEVHLKLGNFGSFGYCWQLMRCVFLAD